MVLVQTNKKEEEKKEKYPTENQISLPSSFSDVVDHRFLFRG